MPTKNKTAQRPVGPASALVPLTHEEVRGLRVGDNITSVKYLKGGYARLLKKPHAEKLKDGTDTIVLSVRDLLSEYGVHDFQLVVCSSEYKTGSIKKLDEDIALRNVEKAKKKKSE